MVTAEVPPSARAFWVEFEASTVGDVSARFYGAFHFADSEPVANDLARLVLSDIKRATASLLWSYEVENKPLPKPGDLSIVTNWEGQPLCVIETTAMEVVPFGEVNAEFSSTEREGDGSLDHWRQVHWSCFSRECARIGKEPSATMPVACERFRIVYRGGL